MPSARKKGRAPAPHTGNSNACDEDPVLLTALVKLAESSIAGEVRAYFSEMNACKALEKNGDCRCVDNRPATSLRVDDRKTAQAVEEEEEEKCLKAATCRKRGRAKEENKKQDSALATEPRLTSLTAPKRQRRSITQLLVEDMLSLPFSSNAEDNSSTSAHDSSPFSVLPSPFQTAQQLQKPSAAAEGTRPFRVRVTECSTTVLATLPCVVFKHSYVMWAETTVVTEVVRSATEEDPSRQQQPHRDEQQRLPRQDAESSGTRRDEELLQAVLEALPAGKRKRTTASFSPSFPPSSSSSRAHQVAEKQPRECGSKKLESESGTDEHRSHHSASQSCQRQEKSTAGAAAGKVALCFHSLHIVSRTALANPRDASFALQSIFQVPFPAARRTSVAEGSRTGNGEGKDVENGRISTKKGSSMIPAASSRSREQQQQQQQLRMNHALATSLECYPRHMIHFGLPAYALWNRKTLSNGLTDREDADNASAALSRTVFSSLVTAAVREQEREDPAESVADDEKRAANPSVLMLGLGGNVLGQCLDSLLHPAVDLDVVEAEPAVLAACVLHHQTPPLSTRLSAVVGGEDTTTVREASMSRKRQTAAKKGASRAETEEALRRRVAQDLLTMDSGELSRGHALRFPRSSSFSCSSSSAAAPVEDGTVVKGQHGLYTFYLQSAEHFLLTGPDASPPLSPSSSTHLSETEGEAAAAVCRRQYDIIFLDCYDPDEETMLIGGGLVDQCRARLRSQSGCLLVNAHVLPEKSTLVNKFLSHGFAAVQALRVTGCTQCVIACFMGLADREQGSIHRQRKGDLPETASLDERCSRFTCANLRAMCELLNQERAMPSSPAAVGLGDAHVEVCDNHATFQFDAAWMRSCRSLPVRGTPRAAAATVRNRRRKKRTHATAAALTTQQALPDRCCCVWEHKA